MSRPFFKMGIGDLERAFDRERNNPEFLLKLIDELSHRSTDRAARLKARAVETLGTLRSSSNQSIAPQTASPKATLTQDVLASLDRGCQPSRVGRRLASSGLRRRISVFDRYRHLSGRGI